MSIKHELTWRLGLIYLFVLVIAGLIVFWAFRIQIWEGEEWRSKSREFSIKDFEVLPNRGDIYGDDGRILASSIPYYSLYLDCKAIPDTLFDNNADSLALCLSKFFGDDSKDGYKEKLEIGKGKKGGRVNRYLRINKKKITHTQLSEVTKFPIFRERGTRSGLIKEVEFVRIQPHGSYAERTIGYLSEAKDGSVEGRVGLEGAYEKELRGQSGRSIRQMMSGRWVSITVEDPIDGNDIVTTLNVHLQDIVQNALLRQLEHFDADAGTAILMEVKTGDIKAITNLSKHRGGYKEILNHAIGDAAEPGSVFKAPIMAALLDDGFVTPYDTINLDKEYFEYHGRRMYESSRKALGKVTVKEIFEKSSNGISKLVYDNYKDNPEKFIKRLYDMQMNDSLGIEIAGEGKPYIKNKDDKTWSKTTLPWMSIGYEVKATPLQILTFYNAIANNGKKMKPRFVKEIRNGDKVVRKIAPEVMHSQICSKKTVNYLKEMMEGVVENGTAKNLKGTACKIAGKTGTARIADGSKGYNSNVKYRASFVGYFPADDPIYTCIVVVENPSRSVGYYGNVVSGNVFKEIADKVYSKMSVVYGKSVDEAIDTILPISKDGYKSDFLNIYNDLGFKINNVEQGSDWTSTSRVDEKYVLKDREVNFVNVPNVKGMGLRDALYLLENTGLKVGVTGSGAVSKQSLTAGTKVNRGSYIQIELK